MRIRITGPGLFGAKGEIEVGTELTLKTEPTAWKGRYVVIEGDGKGKAAVTNPKAADDGLKAIHRGAGSYSVMRGDDEVVDKLTRDQAEAFNALSEDDKALAVEAAIADRQAA